MSKPCPEEKQLGKLMDFLHGGGCSSPQPLSFLKYCFLIDLITSELHKSAPSDSQQGSQIRHEWSQFSPPEATSFLLEFHMCFPLAKALSGEMFPIPSLENSLGIGASFTPSLCNDANVLFLISSHKMEMNPKRVSVCLTKSCTTSSWCFPNFANEFLIPWIDFLLYGLVSSWSQ